MKLKILNKKIILLIVLIILGFLIYLFFSNSKQIENKKNLTSFPEFKTYRNEEFGFEFQYPENWIIEENTVRTTSSKFNIILSPKDNPYQSNPPILFNLTSPEFSERAFSDLKDIGKEININGIQGIRYDYEEFKGVWRISIILPLGNNHLILGSGRGYESIFNQILSTFKFLK